MAHKELKYDSEARKALEAGVDAVANAVKVTLGPRGRYVVLASMGRAVLRYSPGTGELAVPVGAVDFE